MRPTPIVRPLKRPRVILEPTIDDDIYDGDPTTEIEPQLDYYGDDDVIEDDGEFPVPNETIANFHPLTTPNLGFSTPGMYI